MLDAVSSLGATLTSVYALCVHLIAMLCAASLAELEAANPVEQRPLPSSTSSASSTISDPSVTSTCASLVAPDFATRDFSEAYAPGSIAAAMSAEKWVEAALRVHDKDLSDLILLSMDPDEELCGKVHHQIAHWYLNRTIACDAGVVDDRPWELTKSPPKDCLIKARAFMRLKINQRRQEKYLEPLDDDWGKKLPGWKADAKNVNKEAKRRELADGSAYRHKQDVTPTPDQITAMCCVGWHGDQRVHEDVLTSIETGACLALFMKTAARAMELQKMHLQTIGHEPIPHRESGLVFESVKLTAFETKTKKEHLNQFQADVNPWDCAQGLLGFSILVRRKLDGPPPFTMQVNGNAWKLIGSWANPRTLETAFDSMFKVAKLDRQKGDVRFNIGRHAGSRFLQHQGGTAEGGAAMRGHGDGTARDHYTELPLEDQLRVAHNKADKPWMPAHLMEELSPFADAVLLLLFPELSNELQRVEKRLDEVNGMRGDISKIRTDEQLCQIKQLCIGLRRLCRVALCCIAARPRRWQGNTIIEDSSTLWQRVRDANHRAVRLLFDGDTAERLHGRPCTGSAPLRGSGDPGSVSGSRKGASEHRRRSSLPAPPSKPGDSLGATVSNDGRPSCVSLGGPASGPTGSPSSVFQFASEAQTRIPGGCDPLFQLVRCRQSHRIRAK